MNICVICSAREINGALPFRKTSNYIQEIQECFNIDVSKSQQHLCSDCVNIVLQKRPITPKKPRTIESIPKEINNENTNGKVKREFTFTGELENITNNFDLDNEFKSQFTISEQNSSTQRVPLRSISSENVRKRIFKNTANSTPKTKAIVNELNNNNDNTEQYKEERIQSKENNEPNIDSNTKCGLVFKKPLTESSIWLQQVKSLEKELEQERYSKRELEHEIYMLRQQMEELQNANLQLEKKKLMNEEQKNLSLQFYIQNYTKGG